MNEYEMRLVVQHPSSSFLPLISSLGLSPLKQVVYYVKPHFRFKNGNWETKQVESTQAVYHDGCWFKWVHSLEKPFQSWNHSTYKTFLHKVGNYQDPFTVETRDWVQIDSHAQLYTFQTNHCFKLVFEWEYGTFAKPLTRFNIEHLLKSLNAYRYIYKRMQPYPYPPYTLNENMIRKPVSTAMCEPHADDSLSSLLYAHKLDGIFGCVYSYQNQIKEKWEGYECIVHPDTTLGDGFVFAAEKMTNGQVFLLDVYQVRGHETAGWCRRGILTEFLPQLKLIPNYFVQTYVSDIEKLPKIDMKTDGIIMHDVQQDTIFKDKPILSIDLVYFNGYFHFPDERCIKAIDEELEDGCVYEISVTNGCVIRSRPDRFRGNTINQLDTILARGWNGPPIEMKPVISKCKKKRSKKNNDDAVNTNTNSKIKKEGKKKKRKGKGESNLSRS